MKIKEPKIESFITKGLLKGGFTQEQINQKSPKELREIYASAIQDSIKKFSPNTQNKPKKPKFSFASLKDPKELYEIPLDFFESLSQEDVTLTLHKQFRHISIDNMQKIVKILLCSFQEKLLREIASKLENIPKDEHTSILEIYELQKNNMQHLIQIKQKLDLTHFRERLEEILHIKTKISAYQNQEDWMED